MTYVRGPRQTGPFPDVDALWKSTLDGLVSAKVLRDDSHEWVEIMPVVFERGWDPGTIIELEDIA